jgi:hypothetical protein
MLHSELRAWLARHSEEASDGHDSRHTLDVFHFGSRTIAILGPAALRGALNLSGLCPVTVDAPGPVDATESRLAADVRILLLDDAAMATLPDLSRYRRGPYGSFIEGTPDGGMLPLAALGDWLVCFEEDGSRLLAYDRAHKVALLWFAENPPPREQAELCRPLLHWLAIAEGNVIVHAAAIAQNGRAVLVAGDGNAGKTTLVRACLAAGLDYLGDNVVEVSVDSQATPFIWGVYPSLKVRPGSPLFEGPPLPAPTWDADARKDIYLLGESETVTFQPKPMRHVATLVLHERANPVLARATAASTFFSMAPNTVAQFPFFGSEVLGRVRQVSQHAPTYSAGRLELSQIAEHVRGLLA